MVEFKSEKNKTKKYPKTGFRVLDVDENENNEAMFLLKLPNGKYGGVLYLKEYGGGGGYNMASFTLHAKTDLRARKELEDTWNSGMFRTHPVPEGYKWDYGDTVDSIRPLIDNATWDD